MPSDQLLTYVSAEMARGVTRGNLSRVLLAAGWPFPEVNQALISLGVPMDVAGAPIVEATPPPPPDMTDTPSAMSAVQAPSLQPDTASMPGAILPPAASQDPLAKLPGATALTKAGIAIYRERFGFFIAIGCMQIIIGALFLAAIAGTVLGGAALFALAKPSSSVAIGTGIAAGIVLLLLFAWISSWIALASLQVIRARDERVSFREAFKRARPQAWGLIWIGLLTMLVYLGSLALFGGLAAALVYLGAGRGTLSIIGAAVVGFVMLAGISIAVGTWFSFSIWILADGMERGLSALMVSKGMVRGRFWAIWRRGFVIGLYSALVAIVISIVVNFALFSVPPGARTIASSVVRQVIMVFVVYPILLSAIFSLYASVKERAASADVGVARWKLVVLALIGLAAFAALLFAAVIIVPTLLHAYGALRPAMVR